MSAENYESLVDHEQRIRALENKIHRLNDIIEDLRFKLYRRDERIKVLEK